MSAFLFHGPGAEEEAVEYARNAGRLLAEPLTGDDLGVDGMRKAVGLLSSTVVGSQLGIVVIGPLDQMKSAAASDVLLKTLEDFNADAVLPVLWAADAGEVRGTIRSRSLEVWCPHGPNPYTSLEEDALKLCQGALKRDWGQIIEVIKSPDHKGNHRELLAACAEILQGAARRGTAWIPLWLSIRDALRYTNLSKNEALAALLVERH